MRKSLLKDFSHFSLWSLKFLLNVNHVHRVFIIGIFSHFKEIKEKSHALYSVNVFLVISFLCVTGEYSKNTRY